MTTPKKSARVRKPKAEDVELIMKSILDYGLKYGQTNFPNDEQYFMDCMAYALQSAVINFLAIGVEMKAFNQDLVIRDLTSLEKVLVRAFKQAISGKPGSINLSELDQI